MSRRIDGIYLRPTTTLQEGHILMDLQTGREFTRARVVKTPITDHVIKRVEQIATAQGFKSLKFFNRKNEAVIFPDADRITGVDWPEYNNESEKEAEFEEEPNEINEDYDTNENVETNINEAERDTDNEIIAEILEDETANNNNNETANEATNELNELDNESESTDSDSDQEINEDE